MPTTYNTIAETICPGSPSVVGKAVRIKCGRRDRTLIDQAEIGRGKWARARYIRTQLNSFGWRRLKTLGETNMMCPRCVGVIEEQRIEMTEKWGRQQ